MALPGAEIWHQHMDKRGRFHKLAIWDDDSQTIQDIEGGGMWDVSSASEFKEIVSENRLYVGNSEILLESAFPYYAALHNMKGVSPILTRSQGLVGLRMRSRASGYLLKYSTLGATRAEDWWRVAEYFELMGFEGATLGGVTEKLVRSTLPFKHGIHRPNQMMRVHFCANAFGARVIRNSGMTRRFSQGWELDFTAQYLHQSRSTPTPFRAPGFTLKFDIHSHLPAYINAIVTTVATSVGPLPFRSPEGQLTFPNKGEEVIESWWWKEELQDAEDAGFKIKVLGAWVWIGYSDWLEPWADQMMSKLRYASKQDNPYLKNAIKVSYTTWPGRCQGQPQKHQLILTDYAEKGDQPLLTPYSAMTLLSEYAIRSEPNLSSTALMPQGSFMVMKARRALRDLVLQLNQAGVKVHLANTDGVYISQPPPDSISHMVGSGDGMLKVKRHTNLVITKANVVSDQTTKLMGVSGTQRETVRQHMMEEA